MVTDNRSSWSTRTISEVLPPATGRLRLLVVDMSLSMNAVHEGTSSLDRARSLAERIVNAAPPGDNFSLVRICRTPPLTVVPRAADDRSAVLEQVRQLSATPQRGDVAGALRAVQACLREHDSQTRPEIVLISDFQATNWKPSDAREQQVITGLLSELADVAELTCLPVLSTPALDNLAVTGVRPVSGGPPGAPIGAAEVAVLNAALQPVRDVRVEVFAGQRVAGQGTVNIPAGGVTITGLNAGDYQIDSEDCASQTLNTGESCQVKVVFAPTAFGGKNAALEVAHDCAGLQQAFDNAAANDDAQRAVKILGSGWTYDALAAAQAEQGDFAAAMISLARANELDPNGNQEVRAQMRSAFEASKPYRSPPPQ